MMTVKSLYETPIQMLESELVVCTQDLAWCFNRSKSWVDNHRPLLRAAGFPEPMKIGGAELWACAKILAFFAPPKAEEKAQNDGGVSTAQIASRASAYVNGLTGTKLNIKA